MDHLKQTDPEIWQAIKQETTRQQYNLELIASENFTSRAVLEAAGSILTNKYAEGYPDKRYYGGCEYIDVVETLAIERAKLVFDAEHANVQPHSGTQANMAAYFALIKPGDTMLAMDIAHGGHLSHGMKINFSGIVFNAFSYGVDPDTERLDYDAILDIAKQCKPKLIVAGASAYARRINFHKIASIAEEVGAYFVADIAHIAGLVIAKLHPSPVPYAEAVTTTTHKTLRGPRGGIILCKKDYAKAVDQNIFPGIQGGPLMHIIAAKAVALKEAMTDEFIAYQKQIVANARALAGALIERGYRLVSGGTDTHMMLVDLTDKNMSGKEAEELLHKAGITVNKNLIPFDKRNPRETSGIRIGTPALTTRGMTEAEMVRVADLIDQMLASGGKKETAECACRSVRKLCEEFPLYEGLEI